MTRLQHRLLGQLHNHPILLPTLAGVLIRMITAFFGLGFHARDDYFHVLEPALYWLNDPTFDWDTSTLAGAGIRSHLVPRVVYGLLLLCHSLNITSPEAALRVLYSTFGLYNALAIPGGYFLARALFKSDSPSSNALIAWTPWVLALHFSMPYAGTRLLIEAMAIPPLLWGLYCCSSTRLRQIFFGGCLIGLGCWFRYQLGAATLGLSLWLFQRARRSEGSGAGLLAVGALALGGGCAILLQGLFDLWTTGKFLGPLLANIAVNLSPPEELSRSNLLNYAGFWLLITLPPLTIPLLPALVKSIQRWPLISWPWLSFTLLHSLVGHKEERFMLPVLPLFLLLLVPTPAQLSRWREEGRTRLANLWRVTAKWSLGLHLIALLLVVGNQSQANLREAMIQLRPRPSLQTIVSLGPELQTYFLQRPEITLYRNRKFDARWLKTTLNQTGAVSSSSTAFLSFSSDRARVGILLMAEGLQCAHPTSINGWWLDRLIYKLNPRRNLRRSPIDLWSCRTSQVASTPSPLEPVFHARAPGIQSAH